MLYRVLLVCVLLLGGCIAAPPDQPTASDVRVDVTSDHDQAYVITVGSAPAGHTALAVEFVNGTVREFPDADGIEDVPAAALSQAVSLRPVGDAAETRTYRWGEPQGASATFEDVPRNATVFYAVATPTGPEPMRTLGRVTCGPQATLTTVTLRITADGSIAVSNDCAVE